ncbi:MAG: hypothetical protein GY842_14125 [bacterium]|nr:hypothetical protein [bacterium]
MRTRVYIGSALATLLAVDLAMAQIADRTRQDIIDYAVTGIGSPYVWGGGSWDPDNRAYGGADCSGFVSKSWSLTRWTPFRVEYHGPYSTGSLISTPGTYWDEVDRSEMLYGDAIVYRYDTSSGHTYIYLAGDGWGEHLVYEARGTAYGIVHRWRTVPGGMYAEKGIRRDQIVENIDVTEHIIETDDGAPYYTDSGMTGNSQYDSYALGCQEGNCRYRWVTATRNETCTFTPDLPDTGLYRIYVTCNEDDENVSGVGVTINHASGADAFVWDQDYDLLHNTWVPMGDESFLFNAGMSGSVVWDDYSATPTDGNHVFRGDATKFSLDNRVEVDGVGGATGKHATIRGALSWLASNESEEPNVINITCDTLTESGCIEVNLLDDVTINGDADDNGVPVTITVTPGAPVDWSSRSCGMYFDIPIQHTYTVRDIVLIPQFVSAGYATNAYGLIIDEQNPSGDACAMSLVLENVTVAGSLPGNVPTDAEVDARGSATLFGSSDSGYGAAVFQRNSDWAGDDGCRQAVTATDLTVTHSATRGIVVRASYTDWVFDGGLVVSYSNLEGIKTDQLGGSTLTIRGSNGGNPNQLIGNDGGGLANLGNSGVGTVVLEQAIIRENGDSGVYSDDATTTVRNCIITNNDASGAGGGVAAIDGTLTVRNCTIVDNTSGGGAGGIDISSASATIAQCILWGNTPTETGGSPLVTYSDVQGGYAGLGNIDEDPQFIDSASADYHLKRSSPCVNAGDPTFTPEAGETDIDGDARVQGGFADMGADETPYWDGDLDQDGDVDLDDFAGLVDCLSGPEASPAPTPPVLAQDCLDTFDFDEDGDVDLADCGELRLRQAGEPSEPVDDVLLESRDAGGSVLPAPAYLEEGSWSNSTAKSTAAGLSGSGSRFITYDLPSTGTDNATFVPDIVTPGWYEVFATWGTGANCYDAQYTIQHSDGQTVVLVDQIPEGVAGANANTWVTLGQYQFDAGQDEVSGSINVSEETVTGKPHATWNQRVYADAAKWVFAAP